MQSNSESAKKSVIQDFLSGWSVFLIAVPVSVGLAQGFGVSIYAGLIAGIVGGLVVGAISGSHTSVSGPSAGLSVIILGELAILESFESLLLALLVAGVIQIGFGLLRIGALS